MILFKNLSKSMDETSVSPCDNRVTVFVHLADCAKHWAVQKKLKLNMVITPFLTESMKLSRQLLILLKERDPKVGMIHGTSIVLFFLSLFFVRILYDWQFFFLLLFFPPSLVLICFQFSIMRGLICSFIASIC